MAAALYVCPLLMTFVTVKVTLLTLLVRRSVFTMLHRPLAFVLQLTLPVAPLVHLPRTVAPLTGTLLPLTTLMVAVAFQRLPPLV